MNDEARNTALYEKMSKEQSAYRDWLLKQTPEEILHHTFEYTVREDILMAAEDGNLSGEQVRALLRSDSPLADVYKDFQKQETGYMDTLRECIAERANAEIQREQEQIKAMRETPVYLFPAAYARQNGEMEQYHASRQANIACRQAIDRAIQDHYDGWHLDSAAIRQVADAFGYERMFHVLANTIRQKEWDGRFSANNKRWAHTVPVYEDKDGLGDDRNREFALRSHSAIADVFIQEARHEYLLAQPLSKEEITAEAQRIFDRLKAAREPNSPNRTHFMVEISPDFLRRAGDKEQDTLMRLLPFKTISFSSLNGHRGIFALISKDEDRASKTALRKPSVRRRLKQQQPDTPPAPKPPAQRKSKNPEL